MSRIHYVLVVVAVVGWCAPCLPQSCDPRSGPPIQMQAQLSFSDQAAEPGSVSTQNDSMHRDDAAGAQQSHSFAANLQIRVQLQDALGGTLQETTPNEEG